MSDSRLLSSLVLILSLFALPLIKTEGQAILKNKDIDIIYIGNSITEGGQHDNPQVEAPPATASAYLRNQPGIGSIEFSNQGRSGYTTVDYLPSVEGALTEVIVATHELHKDNKRLLIFSISLGTNDSAEKGPNGSPVSPGIYQKNLKSIADKLLAEFPGCKIFLQQPIWYSPNTYNSSRYMAEGLARLQTYFPELKSLVKNYAQTNPGHVFTGDLKGFVYFRDNFQTDLIPESGNAGTFYLHPNKKGSAVLGRFWGEAIYKGLFND
jgi:lysophospholipase L1-like esterase